MTSGYARTARHDPSKFLAVRSILETPILDERKWNKVRTCGADALFLDLEDSVAPDRKAEALERVLAALAERDTYPMPLIARANPLGSPTGRDEIIALAEAGVEHMTYPKLRSGDELREVTALLHEHGADPDILAIVETAEAVENLPDILAVPQVVGVLFGPGDLAVDMGVEVHGLDGRVEREAFAYARGRLVTSSAARGIARFDIAFVENLRDFENLRNEVAYSRRVGFTGMTTFYPPHLSVIHEVFSPSSAEVEHAQQVIREFAAARARGDAAVQVDGRALLVHDYERAQRVLSRASCAADDGR